MNETLLRKYEAPFKPLITFVDGGGGPATKYFLVPIPDSRLRVKISVLFVPAAGGAPNASFPGTSTLWLYESDKDRSGTSGINIPCTDIEGTSAAPTTLPASSGLGGYSRELVTAADYIEGRLVSTAGGPMIGSWVLQVRYQPNAVRFTEDEWNKITSQCSPIVRGGAIVVP